MKTKICTREPSVVYKMIERKKTEKKKRKSCKKFSPYWIIKGIVMIRTFFNNRTFHLMNRIAM